MIKKISKIQEHIIFREFKWKPELPEFNKKNVIYGWNGSGKTTLSNLFRALEQNRNISEGEVEFVIDDQKLTGKNIEGSTNLPNVKVFNRDFIRDTVFSSSGTIAPIYYIAEDSREKREEIERLEKEKINREKLIIEKGKQVENINKGLNILLVNTANDEIKSLLRSSGSNPYNNYDKRALERKLNELQNLNKVELNVKVLSEEEFDQLKEKIQAKPKKEIPPFTTPFPEFESILNSVKGILKQTVLSNALKELEDDGDLSSWVRTGLNIHKNRESETCLFCKNEFKGNRKLELEQHFNDAYNAFITQLDSQTKQINLIIQGITNYELFPKSNLYDHLHGRYETVKNTFVREKERAIDHLSKLVDKLNTKKGKPFEEMQLHMLLFELNNENFKAIEKLISDHNLETQDFEKEIDLARRKIEDSIATGKVKNFTALKKNKVDLMDQIENEKKKADFFDKQIEKLNNEISEHRKPAGELNKDLESYLGRKELEFESFESGYRIKRNGQDAKNLSEGERTAIAFLYFLKSINDEKFKAKERIVVIDDPISSLDSNSIFHAFGFMRACTEDIDQLFILTHNHAFFRQVKNWFNHIKGQRKNDESQRPARFYMIGIDLIKNGDRSAKILELDKLLHQYDSEYHYMFSIVKNRAEIEPANELQEYYHFPNIARRLLEGFLAFKKPTLSHSLQKSIDGIDFDIAKKNQIIRFLHTNSHNDLISEPEHDHSFLAETQSVLNHVLELIESVDKEHYDEMIKCVV